MKNTKLHSFHHLTLLLFSLLISSLQLSLSSTNATFSITKTSSVTGEKMSPSTHPLSLKTTGSEMLTLLYMHGNWLSSPTLSISPLIGSDPMFATTPVFIVPPPSITTESDPSPALI
ncbi:hypothetical protein V6N13_107220 [Hibiscus sabdariffa]|uniref:Uncharacterized protein n=1 Tax=Hibiscus sabdariffa TaxID=183260 RepID=A0ABR2SNI2_9ROSI